MRLLSGIASSGGSALIRASHPSHGACRGTVARSASLLLRKGSGVSILSVRDAATALRQRARRSGEEATAPQLPAEAVASLPPGRTRHPPPPSPLTLATPGALAVPLTHACVWSTRRGFAAAAPAAAAAAAPSGGGGKTKSSKPSSAKVAKGEDGDQAAMGYLALKKARKEKRRELHEASVQRRARLATRRRDPNRGADGRVHRSERKVAFRSWFVAQKVTDEYMNRKARQLGLDWKIQVSAMLIRNSVVLPDKEPWEVDMENLQAHLAQFGKMYPKALIDVDYDAPVAITDEELMELLPEGYTPAPRVTPDDLSGNVRSTNRKLKTDVYLFVQDSPGGMWRLPTASLREGETLLQAARRAVEESVGSGVEHWSVSNAPLSVRMQAFPDEKEGEASCNDPSRDGYYGTKTFFLKLYYDEGEASTAGRDLHDFAWLDRDEVVDKVKEQQGDEVATFYRYLL